MSSRAPTECFRVWPSGLLGSEIPIWGIVKIMVPFWVPYNTGPNTGPNLRDPKRDHNLDNPPYGICWDPFGVR